MLNAVGRALAVLGLLGAGLAAWQLAGWWRAGAPPVAEVWHHSGLTGAILVTFFAALPAVLAAAILCQLLLAWLGVGLLRRKAWALPAARAFALFWIVATAAAWLLARAALADLAVASPERAGFAAAALALAAEAAIANGLVGGAFLMLLLQDAVSREFRPGS
jgi:hypothetical protein